MKAKVLSLFALIALFAWLSGCGENSSKLAGPETDAQQSLGLLKSGEFEGEDAEDLAASRRKTLIADAESPTQMVVWDPDGFYPAAPFTATNIKIFDDGAARGRMVLGTLRDSNIGRTVFTVRSGTIVCNNNLEPVLSLAGTFQNKMPGQKPIKGTFAALAQAIGTAGLKTGGGIRPASHNDDDVLWDLSTNGPIPTLSPWVTVGAVHVYQNPCIAAPQ
jgi:hypothetical protein